MDRVITNLGVRDVTAEGFVLVEAEAGISVGCSG